ncbi:MAG: hypothetical protein A3H93_13365, partial [Rhodocyclales bacterium RIFCSPLOWO2_02_FULL_63_24]
MNANLNTGPTGKRLLRWLAAAMLTIGVTGSALAGIANTKHNLSSSGTGVNSTTSTDQICVFCHTPHAADVTSAGAPPLWNKGMPVTTGFTMYSTDSMQGTALGLSGSPSLACLSCHDGTQAMDSTVNAPGQGLGSGYIGATGNWTGANQTAGKMNSATVALLGKDLSNDHPITIPYCGGGLTAALGVSSTSGSCNDSDFNGVSTAQIGSSQAFWVDTGSAGRQKTDIPLYNRGGTPHVECGSCHDPHVELAAPLVSFMRVSAA